MENEVDEIIKQDVPSTPDLKPAETVKKPRGNPNFIRGRANPYKTGRKAK